MDDDHVGELSLEAAISCVGIFSTKTIEAMSAEHWTPDAKFQEIISDVIRKALAEDAPEPTAECDHDYKGMIGGFQCSQCGKIITNAEAAAMVCRREDEKKPTIQQEADLDQAVDAWVQELKRCHIVIDGVREFDEGAATKVMVKALTTKDREENNLLHMEKGQCLDDIEVLKAKLAKAQGHLQEIRKEPNNQMTWGEWYNRVLEIAEKAGKEIDDG